MIRANHVRLWFLYPRDVGGAEYYQGFIRSLDGEERQLTTPGTRNQNFVIDKHGQVVVWAQVTPGKADYDIVMAPVHVAAEPAVIHKGQGAIVPVDISPDLKRILLSRYISAAESRLYILDAASRQLTPIGAQDRKVAYADAKFAADGRVVVLSDDGREVAIPVLLDPVTGRETPVASRFAPLPREALEAITPLPDCAPAQAKSPSCTGADRYWGVEDFTLDDSRSRIAYVSNADGYSVVTVKRIAGEAPVDIELPKGVVTGMGFSPDGKRLAISLSTAHAAGDIWTYDLDAQTLERWTTSELGGLQASQLVEPGLIRYRTFDGKVIPAFVYRPTGKAKGKRPVIIQIHGGPEAQELPSFSARRQSWVNEIGAVVIVPNVRGSSGYGKTYLSLDNAEKREDSVKDIGALLDWIAAQPDLDKDRVAVVGQSYGGYMALAVAGRYNDRIAGAIDLYGISNWVTFLENTEGYRRDLRRAEYGDERDPAMRKVFDEISPTAYVSAMKKPMMIYQGANDPRVPRSESEAIVARLRAQGTPVWYVLAKDEGHGIARKGNQEAVRATEILFLKQVLDVK